MNRWAAPCDTLPGRSFTGQVAITPAGRDGPPLCRSPARQPFRPGPDPGSAGLSSCNPAHSWINVRANNNNKDTSMPNQHIPRFFLPLMFSLSLIVLATPSRVHAAVTSVSGTTATSTVSIGVSSPVAVAWTVSDTSGASGYGSVAVQSTYGTFVHPTTGAVYGTIPGLDLPTQK